MVMEMEMEIKRKEYTSLERKDMEKDRTVKERKGNKSIKYS